MLRLTDLQSQLPWTVKYSRDFRDNPQSHKDFTHAVVHAMKALGKISSTIDDFDHRRRSQKKVEPYVADLVICALRMANTYPLHIINLEEEVVSRLELKNDVKLNKNDCDLRLDMRGLNQFVQDHVESFCLEFFPDLGLKDIDEIFFSSENSLVLYDFQQCHTTLLTQDILDWVEGEMSELITGKNES